MTELIRNRWRRMSPRARAVLVSAAGLGFGLMLLVAVWAADTDSDGMSDEYESFFGLSVTNPADAALNYDSDTLDNLAEYGIWTDPFSTDTDLDGWHDGVDSTAVSRAWIDWGDPFFTSSNDYEYTFPPWLVSAFRQDGSWVTSPAAWYVSPGTSNDVGRLFIDLDRTVLTSDVVMALGLFDHTNASLYVDLYDTNDAVVATNVFGNLVTSSNVEAYLFLDIPLETYGEAVGVKIRRGSGEITVYNSLLYVDKDGDGLDKEQEDQLGTSDNDTDSDDDGLSDYAEAFTYGTYATDSDSDDDGLSDGDEVNTYGSDPLDTDSDNDGMNDGTEVDHGRNPMVPDSYGTVPFTELFETNTCAVGDLNGQNNWTAAPTNSALVQSDTVYEGVQALELEAPSNETTTVQQLFEDPGNDVVWLDMYLQGTHAEAPTGTVDRSAVCFFDDDGRLVVYDGLQSPGNEWVTLTNHTAVSVDQWVRVTLKLDYSAQTWLVCLDGMVVADGLGFAASKTEFSALTLDGEEGHSDRITVQTSVPEDVSSDWDTLPDVWELTYFGDLDETDSGDPDSDGLTNLQEYQGGTDPGSADTDSDGAEDLTELEWGRNPTNADSYAVLPWTNDFETAEGFSAGDLDGQQGWLVLNGTASVQTNMVFTNNQAVSMSAGTNPPVAAGVLFDSVADTVIWSDFRVQVAPATLFDTNPVRAASVLAVNTNNYWCGLSGSQWQVASNFAAAATGEWAHVTVREDYGTGKWELYVGSEAVFTNLGFADTDLDHFAQFAFFSGAASNSYLDYVHVSTNVPVWVDMDSDGLTNEEEDGQGTQRDNPDSDNDGMSDGEEVRRGFDPLSSNAYFRIDTASGTNTWETGFEPSEGYTTNALNGQNDWIAGTNVMVVDSVSHDGTQSVDLPSRGAQSGPTQDMTAYVGAHDKDVVWITVYGKMPQADPISFEPETTMSVAALVWTNRVYAYDGVLGDWQVSDGEFTVNTGVWTRLDFCLNYTTKKYLVCVNGVLAVDDVGFHNTTNRALARFKVLGSPDEDPGNSYVDDIRISASEPAGLDFDDDGLLNTEEYSQGSDPRDSDTDNDGMPDGWEVDNGLDPNDDADASLDPDTDGLTNLEEYQNGTAIDDDDSDDDGLSDGYEVDTSETDPKDADSDDDGLNDYQEDQVTNTDPNDSDSDDDLMPDGWEHDSGLNPLDDSDATPDPDSDGLSNLEEYQHSCDPSSSDTDEDGLSDGAEVNTYGTDPAVRDTDGDGMGDGAELSHGHSPTNTDTYASLPFSEDFETDTVSVGDLDGQNDWTVSLTNLALVQTNVVRTDAQALEIQSATNEAAASHLIGAAAYRVVWEYYAWQPPRWPEGQEPDTDTNSAVAYYVNTNGQLTVYDGSLGSNNWVTLTNHPSIATSTWVWMEVNQDFSNQTWAIGLDGSNVAANLGFAHALPEYSCARFAGGESGSGYWDDLTVSPDPCYSVSGDAAYQGRQTGDVIVVVVTVSNSWGAFDQDDAQATNSFDKVSPPTPAGDGTNVVYYTNVWVDLSTNSYSLDTAPSSTGCWVKAFRDSNGNRVKDDSEAWGTYAGGVVFISNHVTDAAITMTDPDSDVDGMPDWWEDAHGLDKESDDSGVDPDGDGRANLGEYTADGDPKSFDRFGHDGSSVTNIRLGIEWGAGGAEVAVFYPYDFTNGIDVFICDGTVGLVDFWWDLGASTNVDDATNWVSWVDLESGNAYVTTRFYMAADADVDTDGDGCSDGRELLMYHTDPDDTNSFPAQVSGTVSYSGVRTGTIWVVAVATSNSWQTERLTTLSDPGPYTNSRVAGGTSYWFKAYLDSNGNGDYDSLEASGCFSNAAVYVGGNLPGIDITLTDVDADQDGLGDWWEVAYWDNIAIENGTGDPDGDKASNLLEYLARTDPTAGFVDDDVDGISDDWEDAYGLDKADPDDASEDPDQDGFTNLEEYEYGSLGTNPTDPLSRPTGAIYVDVGSGNDTTGDGSYTNRYESIGKGLDMVATNGGRVVVFSGTYTGSVNRGLTFPGNVLLLGVQGASNTVVDCEDSDRAISISSGETNAVIRGFTIRNGYVSAGYGGAALCSGVDVEIVDCTIEQNYTGWGGAIYVSQGSVAIRDCDFWNNSASDIGGYGAAVYLSNVGQRESLPVIDRCRFASNSSQIGGAVMILVGETADLRNSLFANNAASYGGAVYLQDVDETSLENCTIVSNTAGSFGGGYCEDTEVRNCVFWGNATNQIGGTTAVTYSVVQDWDDGGTGNTDEDPGFLDGTYRIGFLSPCWNAGLPQAWMGQSKDLLGSGRILNGAPEIGAFELPVHYAAAGNGAAAAPYTNWTTAAATIQDAIDAAQEFGAEVVVTNGVYDQGATVVGSGASNRVAVIHPICVRSVNGYSNTVVVGQGPVCASAVRGVYVGSNARFIGFTVTNGHTLSLSGSVAQYAGGGIWCEADGSVEDCLIVSNRAHLYGGGIYGGTAVNCVISGNHSDYAGGGAASADLRRCIVGQNTATLGGGANGGSLRSSLLSDNVAVLGGGAFTSVVENCTVVHNETTSGGGGTYGGAETNCIIYYNSPDNWTAGIYGGSWSHCCTTPEPSGSGHITNAPGFVDAGSGDYHRLAVSPCLNAGTNLAWSSGAVDLDGAPRLEQEIVDMGAYEMAVFLPATMLVLDASGSMKSYEMATMKWQSGRLVDSLSTTDMVGVVSFNSSASNVWTLAPIGQEENKADVKGAVYGLASSGETAIHAGLNAAQLQLAARVRDTDNRTIVLMTDAGDSSFSPTNYFNTTAVPAGTRIHTVNLYNDWCDDFLSWVPQRRGGVYLAKPTPAGVMTIAGLNGIAAAEGTISAGTTNMHEVLVDTSVSGATFRVSWEWNAASIDCVMQMPDGTTIDPDTATSMPEVVYHAYAGCACYSVEDPTNGVWTVRVSGGTVGEAYTTCAYGTSGHGAELFLDRLQYATNDTVPLLVVTQPDATNVYAVATNVWRSESAVVDLYDDGAHSDGGADDGLYGGSLTNTATAESSWRITTHVEGVLPNDSAFHRVAEKSVYVVGSRPQLATPTNVVATDGTYGEEVEVTWSGVSNTVNYDVYRNVSDTRIGASLVGIVAGSTSFTDTDVVQSQTYYYWVRAYRWYIGSKYLDSEFSASDSGYAAP